MKELRFVQDCLRDILEAMDKAEEFTNGRPAITMCLTAH